MWERRVPTRRALNRRAAGPAACPIQSWLRDTAAVVSKAAQQQVGLISGQAGKTGWGCEGCVRAVGNGNKGEKMHDAYAHNLDELDDGKEEGSDRGKIYNEPREREARAFFFIDFSSEKKRLFLSGRMRARRVDKTMFSL